MAVKIVIIIFRTHVLIRIAIVRRRRAYNIGHVFLGRLSRIITGCVKNEFPPAFTHDRNPTIKNTRIRDIQGV